MSHRVRGSGCPYDAGRLPIPGVTDLATLRPDLVAEWNYEENGDLRPEDVTLPKRGFKYEYGLLMAKSNGSIGARNICVDYYLISR